ncbi:hypothetical protein RRG08_055779 [Elysia crispata]|uniref:Uncharacterized protein n=1 Tax=Elysia crispata TaxID=231223 RepID=A0AAE0XSL9_9GAST|nr:hypothetical protein RRG08_055779 [Elysia crispata]
MYNFRAAAVAVHLQPLGSYLYDIRVADVALHLQPLGLRSVRYQRGCCNPVPTDTGGPTCMITEQMLHWGPYLYDIRADAVALHLQSLGPYLYDIRADALTLHLQPLGPYLYDIRAAAVALHLQPLEPIPVRCQSGCCRPAPTAIGTPTCTISERMLHLGPYLYNNSGDAVALHLQLLEPLPVEYQSGCCSPAPTATGPRPVRYQSGCCSPAPTATAAPTCTILERLLAAAVALHLQPLGPDLYDMRAASVALHLQPLGPLPVQHQSGCFSPAPTATGAPTCTTSEWLL